MKCFYPLCSLALLGWLGVCPALGQVQLSDSSFLAVATAQMSAQQLVPTEAIANLYSGTEYIRYEKAYRTVKGHQFFLGTEEYTGDIFYDGALYRNVPLQYDIRFDQLVLKFPQSPYQLKLPNEKLVYFTVNQHRFVHVAAVPTPGSLPAGFYDVLLEGQTRLLAKRIKKTREILVGSSKELVFEESSRFYLEKNGTIYPITSKGALLAALVDKKKELRQYISTQKLKFSKNRQEGAFVKTAQYYNTLL